MSYSVKNSVTLINEVQKALEGVIYGSVELYVQNRKITQITVRHIKKTNVDTGTVQEKETQRIDVKIGT